MSERILSFTIVAPRGITPAAPTIQPMSFVAATVEKIGVLVPPGPSGYMGFHIDYGGGQVIPEGDGNWIVADDHYFEFPLTDPTSGGNWSISTYNQGTYNHTLYLYFYVNNLNLSTGTPSSAVFGI